MRETNIYMYYAFGYNYHLLYKEPGNRLVHGDGDSLVSMIDGFFDKLDELDLQVTRKAAYELREVRKRLDDIEEEAVTEELASEVSEACGKLDVTLDSELKLRKAYTVTPRRFSTENLLDEPLNLLGTESKARLPDIAIFDFSAACKAVAFGLATASVFHLMRCVESMLREYYCSIVKRNRVKNLLWNPMVEHLRKRQDSPPKTVLDHLDNIRANVRNPTQHPDARYELEEAQDLLSVSVDALNRMSRDLSNREV